MANAIREAILAQIKTTLDGATLTGTPTIERRRDFEVSKFPTVNLIGGDHSVDNDLSGVDRDKMELVAELYVQGDETAFNQLYRDVTAAIKADLTVGGNAVDLTELGLEFPEVPADDPHDTDYTLGLVAFEIEYWVDESDPAVLAT